MSAQTPTKRSCGWVFTQNNYSAAEWKACCEADCKYIVCAKEVAPSTGTPHIQGFVFFRLQRTWSAQKAWFDKLFGRAVCWFEASRGDALANYEYCSKEQREVHEHGERPVSAREKGENEKQRAQRNFDAIMEGRMDDVDIDVKTHQLKNYEYGAARMKRFYREKPADLDGVLDNTWVWGPPGSGKDRFVLKEIGDRPHYKKSIEPYWDEYDDEEDVLIRDYDGGEARNLKIWCDRYAFDGRRMFGRDQCIIRPKRIWVTSNFHPDDLFKGVDAAAMRRRFQIIHLANGVAKYEHREAVEIPPSPIKVRAAPRAAPPSPNRFTSPLSDL